MDVITLAFTSPRRRKMRVDQILAIEMLKTITMRMKKRAEGRQRMKKAVERRKRRAERLARGLEKVRPSIGLVDDALFGPAWDAAIHDFDYDQKQK
jgi:hypothetical protein